jgi:hypothetical protein
MKKLNRTLDRMAVRRIAIAVGLFARHSGRGGRYELHLARPFNRACVGTD